jgi:plastocyanin
MHRLITPRSDFVTFFRYIRFDFTKIFSNYSIQSKTIMKKILFLAALLIGSVSAAWAADHPVTVSNFVFTPSTVNAAVGDTISWTWTNGMHTTTAVSVPAGARPWIRRAT